MTYTSPDIIAKIRAEVERHGGPEYARELLKEIDRLAMLVKSAPQGDAAPDNEIILQTQVAVSVTPERWNELQDELLLWRYRTLKALQHLKGFTGIRDLNELQAILDDDERRWKEIESGISVLLSDSDKAWMVPLAHKNGLTLGDWIIQTVRGAASSSGSSPLRERPLSPADLPLTFGMPKEPEDDMGGQST